MKVMLVIPKEDAVINQFVKKWPKVEVISEVHGIDEATETSERLGDADVVVIGEDIHSQHSVVVDFMRQLRHIAQQLHIILLSNADPAHDLISQSKLIGVSVIPNLPELSLVQLARTMFIHQPNLTLNTSLNPNHRPMKMPSPLSQSRLPAEQVPCREQSSNSSDTSDRSNKSNSQDGALYFLPKDIQEFVLDPNNLDYLNFVYHLKYDRRLSVKSVATIIDHCCAIKGLLKEME